MTYLYCVIRSTRKPSVARAADGLPGAGPVRVLDAGGGMWLIVSDVDLAQYNETAIANGLKDLEWVSTRAIGHEAVVERFLRSPALVPMQLFTIFASDERALAYVSRDRKRIARMLDRVEGHQEWGLRLTWDEEVARSAVEKSHRAASDAKTRSGSAYLARKRDLLDVRRTQVAAARAEATSAHERISKEARDAVRRTATEQAAPGSRLLLDAAYLVPVARGSAFRASVRRVTRPLSDLGIAATLTGPWPPYNFLTSR